ncbi:MAG TPA: hypothetical protein PK640_08265 [Verrucomicrobiota bacterium]|nr:hypothetical protein [Verrucomicrobiota bacterium]
MNAADSAPNHWQRTTTRRVLVWLFRWVVLRRVLLVIAMLVTLPALFYAVENWRGKRAWDQHRRALEAQGERFMLGELAPPSVPDAQNLALAPMLKPLFNFARSPDRPLEWLDTNGLNRLERMSIGRREGDPAVGNLDQGTFADFEACARFYRGNTNYLQADPASSPAEVVRVALAAFDADVAELRAAAATRPVCRFPIDYAARESDGNPFAILLPHLGKLKGISLTLALRATAGLELKQSAAAFADWELALRLSNCLRDEPLLIDHLVRVAMVGVNLQVVREGLVRQAWSEEQLTGLQRDLATVDLLAEYGQAIRGERACVVQTLDWARRQGWRFDPTDLLSFQGDSSEPGRSRWLWLMPGGWYCRNMVVLSRLHQDYTLAAVSPQQRRVSPPIAREGRKAVEALPTRASTIFARQLFPAVINGAAKIARMQTYVDAARVACALERHRLATGERPASLDPLVPRFLDRLPHDLIDGQPLRYRLLPEGGYVLYSIGWDEKDDGGKSARPPAPKGVAVEVQEGDWVWSLPR